MDDEIEFVKSIERYLKRESLTLVTANNGVDAQQLILREAHCGDPFDLVITDLIMPGIDGWRLTGWILENHPHISLLILTGTEGNDKLRKLIRPGMDHYLQKSITPMALIGIIHDLDVKRSPLSTPSRSNFFGKKTIGSQGA